jgi:hypothetical protein
MQASCTANADTYNIKPGTFMEMQPVTGVTG